MTVSLVKPEILTFDIFGTVVDWRRGLEGDLGRALPPDVFDRIVDAQGALEAKGFRPYREIVAESLVKVLRLPRRRAAEIGLSAGRWPLFPDAREGLRRLLRAAPCVAMTNSDRLHGDQVQAQLGFRLTDWVAAEDLRRYKPAPAFWEAVSFRRGLPFGPWWWHVSAYADYDLDVARALGLTAVFIPRPHARPGIAPRVAADLRALATLVE